MLTLVSLNFSNFGVQDQDTDCRTGKFKESRDMTTLIGQPVRDSRYRTVGVGQSGQDSRCRTVGTGQTVEHELCSTDK